MAMDHDFASRLIAGSSLTLGVAVGLLAGFAGGWVDEAHMLVVDIWLAFPFIIRALAVFAAVGPGLGNLILVITVTSWVDHVRVVRAEVLALREREFVQAARAMGGGEWRVILRHLLPNVAPTIIVLSTLALARIIILESSLSYLGLPPSVPSWGLMLATSQQFAFTGKWWLGVFPAAILLTVMAISLVGDRLRDVLDPKVD